MNALDPDTVRILRAHRSTQAQQRLKTGPSYRDQGLMFAGPSGGPLDPSVVTHTFRKLARQAGYPSVRLHDLRHFHATALLRAGTHPKIVQERLGHSTIGMTLDTYSHVVPSMQEAAAEAFEKLMARGRRAVKGRGEPPP